MKCIAHPPEYIILIKGGGGGGGRVGTYRKFLEKPSLCLFSLKKCSHTTDHSILFA